MLPSEAISIINRLRNQGSDFEQIADVLTDLARLQSASLTGSLEVESADQDVNALVDPPDYPALNLDQLGFTIRVANRNNFMAPGSKGAQGGFTGRMRGPFVYVPNRENDLVIWAPNGGIDAKTIYKDGEEVIIIPPPPEEGDCTLKAIGGVLQWSCEATITTECCEEGEEMSESYVFEWTSTTASGETIGGGSITITWDGSVWYGEETIQVPNGAGGTIPCDLTVQLNCDSPGAFFTIAIDGGSAAGDTVQSAGGVCNPLNLVFSSALNAGCAELGGCSVHA